ncbi:MAG: hypothetical protein Q4E24_16765, partial [bacterium]|nr:hypothetical protein [bacterium]
VDKIYYSKQLFPCTYYYDPDNAAIPIVLNLNIYGTRRLPTIKDDSEFCKYILDFVGALKHPDKEKLFSYLLAQDDGLRSEILAEYIRRSNPSPDLYDLFLSFYTMTDYGAGAYDTTLLQKLFSGRSDEQIKAVSAALSDLPEIISIYRGEAEGSTPYHRAFSWSIDINAAFFFACRHGDKDHARIIRAKVQKKDIMAAILDGSEKEIIVLPGAPFEVSQERLIGPGSPLVMPPKYLDEYVEGRERIRKVYELHKSARDSHSKRETSEHDMVHSARVLFLAFAIIQAGKIKLSNKELEQLSEAIAYHDIGRRNDEVDNAHGAASRKVYERQFHDPAVSFLIEYHCLDDRRAQDYLTYSPIKGKSRAWLLYQITKDADALDRVRFGILDLDVNFLRLPISHKLVPLAVTAVSGIKM